MESEIEEASELPPIRVINFNDFRSLSSFPRYPDNSDITVDIETLDPKKSLFIFISHCWLRGWHGADGWDGRPHPDDPKHTKFKLCVEGISKLIEPGEEGDTRQSRYGLIARDFVSSGLCKEEDFKAYVWLDFGCINQDGDPAGELKQLDEIVKCMDIAFTPLPRLLSDGDEEPWHIYLSFCGTYTFDFENDYGAAWRGKDPCAYISRAWCRMEVLYFANVPRKLWSGLDEDTQRKRHNAIKRSRTHRYHVLYGENNDATPAAKDRFPHMVRPLEHNYISEFHPLKGNLTKESDRSKIAQLINQLEPYMKVQETEEYEGEKDKCGLYHGKGVLKYTDGRTYTGLFEDGVRHGWGKLETTVSVYEGMYKFGLRHGFGREDHANGNFYEGEWVAGDQEGTGMTYKRSNGTLGLYTGEFKNGCCHGNGVIHSGKHVLEHGQYVVGDLFKGTRYNYDVLKGNGEEKQKDMVLQYIETGVFISDAWEYLYNGGEWEGCKGSYIENATLKFDFLGKKAHGNLTFIGQMKNGTPYSGELRDKNEVLIYTVQDAKLVPARDPLVDPGMQAPLGFQGQQGNDIGNLVQPSEANIEQLMVRSHW